MFMTNTEAWRGMVRELDVWKDGGLRARFWVRDDDAVEMSGQLAQLHDIADRHELNIGLAVIPGKMRPGFVDILAQMRKRFYPMCHGWVHADYGRPGKPGEFGRDRPFSRLRSDAEQAYTVFSNCFGTTRAIFVPPNGRITFGLRKALPRIGFAAVSTGPSYFERKILRMSSALPWMPAVAIRMASVIPRFDVHIDVMDWRRKTARDSEAVAAEIVENLHLRRRGFLAPDHPIGLLTHHLVHDEQVWRLCNELLDALSAHETVDFVRADSLFEACGRSSAAASPSVSVFPTRVH
jgi:predicted deacetylase